MRKQKLKSTISKHITRQTALFASIMLVLGSVVSVPLLRAETLQQQIAKLQSENIAKQSEVQTLQIQADGLQATIDGLQVQINGLQSQIQENTNKSIDLEAQIAAAQIELDQQKAILGENIKAMYLEGDISTIEMLATSKDLSDYFDKQQYRETVKTKIKNTLDKVTELKVQLKEQQAQVKALIEQQISLQAQVSAQKGEQDRLLNLNQDQRSTLDAEMRTNYSNIAELHRQQAAAIAALAGSNGSSRVGSYIEYKNLVNGGRCGGGYEYCDYGFDQFVYDPWGLGLARECVHYTAWALANRGFIDNRKYFNGNGNANQWAGVMSAQGEAYTDNNPEGAAMVYLPVSTLGHVAMIEQNYGNGWVRVSQYNWMWPGNYSEMDLKVTSNLLFFHF